MVSEELEDSLRREIESYVESRLSGIKQEISALQSQLNESLSRLMDKNSEVQLDGGVASSILEHLRAAHEEGIDLAASESARSKASSEMAKVKAALTEINGQDSQTNILKTLINRASAFAPRVAFFVIKGDQSIGWRARGFEGSVGDDIIQKISFPVAADTAIGSVAKSRETWSGGPGSHGEDHILLNRLGDEPPIRIVAVPLVVRQKTVAVLYADSSNLDSEAINLEALETLVTVSGMAVELLASRSGSAKASAPAARVEEPPAYAPVAEYDEVTPVVEESAPARDYSSGETGVAEAEVESEAPRYEATPEVSEASPEAATFDVTPEPAPTVVEPEPPVWVAAPPAEEAVDAARSYEVEPPPSPATSAEPQAPTPTRRRYGADAELPIEVADDEERRLHNDARRFARLLVSEIKLYNEKQVVEGRAQNDLYVRLREYIDRSREMYDKRVKPDVAQKFDYFHYELVNTLAEGDMAKLGSAYPGTTVSA